MNTVKLSLAAAFAATFAIALAGCNATPPPPSATLDSGITSSNGGGARQLGNLPDVTVGPNGTSVTQLPRDPRTPRY